MSGPTCHLFIESKFTRWVQTRQTEDDTRGFRISRLCKEDLDLMIQYVLLAFFGQYEPTDKIVEVSDELINTLVTTFRTSIYTTTLTIDDDVDDSGIRIPYSQLRDYMRRMQPVYMLSMSTIVKISNGHLQRVIDVILPIIVHYVRRYVETSRNQMKLNTRTITLKVQYTADGTFAHIVEQLNRAVVSNIPYATTERARIMNMVRDSNGRTACHSTCACYRCVRPVE